MPDTIMEPDKESTQDNAAPAAEVQKRSWFNHRILILDADRISAGIYKLRNEHKEGAEQRYALAFVKMLGLVAGLAEQVEEQNLDLWAIVEGDEDPRCWRFQAGGVPEYSNFMPAHRAGGKMAGKLSYDDRNVVWDLDVKIANTAPQIGHRIEITGVRPLYQAIQAALGSSNPDRMLQFTGSFMRMLHLASGFWPDAEAVNQHVFARIGDDCSKFSFNFDIRAIPPDEDARLSQNNGKRTLHFMNGGLIYHGPHDDGSGGAPAFSADLGRSTASPEERAAMNPWSIHT